MRYLSSGGQITLARKSAHSNPALTRRTQARKSILPDLAALSLIGWRGYFFVLLFWRLLASKVVEPQDCFGSTNPPAAKLQAQRLVWCKLNGPFAILERRALLNISSSLLVCQLFS